MWAHYAHNLSGFVLELDESKLASYFPKSTFEDVEYLEKPDELVRNILEYAYVARKPRYVYRLHHAVFNSAYFRKNSCWNYEHERRMVLDISEANVKDGSTFIDIPNDCITSIICGPRATSETTQFLNMRSQQTSCSYFEMKIGKNSSVPFYQDRSGNSFLFDGEIISSCSSYCKTCREPIAHVDEGNSLCPWCGITESMKENAALRNPYRLLAHVGLLDDYLKGMDAIPSSIQITPKL